MFCNQCGTKLPDNVMFCPECGAKQETYDAAPEAAAQNEASNVPVSVPPVPEKKKRKLYKIFIPAGVLLTAAILICVFLIVGNRKENPFTYVSKDTLVYWQNHFSNLSGESLELTEEIYSYHYSGDGSTVVYWTEDYSLYYINGDMESILVAEDVNNVRMALSGDYLAYTVAEEEFNFYEGILYVYDVKGDKSTKISEDIYPSDICISPDGKTVAYMKDYEGLDDNTLYLCTLGREEKKIDKDGCFPVAISEGGKYFYYANYNDKLYCFDGKDTEKIAADVSGYYWFNSSMTEMLYIKNGKTYYYNPKMEEAVRVCNSEIDSVAVPDEEMAVVPDCCSSRAHLVGKISLKDSVLENDGTLYWLNKNGTDTVKIGSNIYEYQISEDGKSLLYMKGSKLYKINKFNEEMEAKLLYDEMLEGFAASADLSKIYIITVESELCYLKNNQKTERISIDFSIYNDYAAYNEACGKIFYTEDNDLYCAGTTAKSKEKVAEDVSGILKVFDGIIYVVDDDNKEIYYYMEKEPVEVISMQW